VRQREQKRRITNTNQKSEQSTRESEKHTQSERSQYCQTINQKTHTHTTRTTRTTHTRRRTQNKTNKKANKTLLTLRAHVDEHGGADMLQQSDVIRVSKDGIPQQKHIVEVELPRQHQPHPRQTVQLRLDLQRVHVCLQLWVRRLEDVVLYASAALHHRGHVLAAG
jgi:hypothetical protein